MEYSQKINLKIISIYERILYYQIKNYYISSYDKIIELIENSVKIASYKFFTFSFTFI